MLQIVETHQIDGYWPLIGKDLEAACRRCDAHELNAGVLWQMCRSGQAYLILWVVDGEILVKSVWRFDAPKQPHSFRCVMLSGKNMRHWLRDYYENIKQLAKTNGATQLVTTGRVGWLKLFPNAEKIGKDYEVDI